MHKFIIITAIITSLLTFGISRMPAYAYSYIYACSAVAILIALISWNDMHKTISKIRK